MHFVFGFSEIYRLSSEKVVIVENILFCVALGFAPEISDIAL